MPPDTHALLQITNSLVSASGALSRTSRNRLSNDFADATTALITLPAEAGTGATLPASSHAAIQCARRLAARVAADCAYPRPASLLHAAQRLAAHLSHIGAGHNHQTHR